MQNLRSQIMRRMRKYMRIYWRKAANIILNANLQQKRPNSLWGWKVKRSSTRLEQTKENTFPSKHITKFRILLPQVTVEAEMANVLKWDWTSRWNINNAMVRKGAVGLLVLHIVGDLFKSTLQNTNEGVTWSFNCLYLLAQGKKKKKRERLKTKEYVMPIFIPQRS